MNKLIDQHVWYEGSVDLYNDNDDYNFSDLSDESKESIASAIVESIRKDRENGVKPVRNSYYNDNDVTVYSDLVTKDGKELPNVTVNFSCSELRIADKYGNNFVTHNEREAYLVELPDFVAEQIVRDILDAQDGKIRFSQLDISGTIGPDKFEKYIKEEAKKQEAEKEVNHPEKKKSRYRGR